MGLVIKRTARVSTTKNSSRRRGYETYEITFNDERHFDNWYNKVSKYRKIIGIEWIDGSTEWKTDDDPFDAMICDQRWNAIKGLNE